MHSKTLNQYARWLDEEPLDLPTRLRQLCGAQGCPPELAATLIPLCTSELKLRAQGAAQGERTVIRALLKTERHSGKEMKASITFELTGSDRHLAIVEAQAQGISLAEACRRALREWTARQYDAALVKVGEAREGALAPRYTEEEEP